MTALPILLELPTRSVPVEGLELMLETLIQLLGPAVGSFGLRGLRNDDEGPLQAEGCDDCRKPKDDDVGMQFPALR